MKDKIVLFLALGTLSFMVLGNVRSVEAANIVCNSANNPCLGTDDDDNMVGDTGPNDMRGFGGNDNIKGLGGDDSLAGNDDSDHLEGGDGNDNIGGSDGNDLIDGGSGNDKLRGDTLFIFRGNPISCIASEGADTDDLISGGSGNDEIIGCSGADRISGGSGDDQIIHGGLILKGKTEPDGSKDRIDCGPGNDEAWINISQDHDEATNCEILHTG
jgi:Ca2+-binding RTX toxin-like protein